MSTAISVRQVNSMQQVAALAIGAVALLMVGVQPIVLGELVDKKLVTLEGVGLVAMGEIVTIGLGVLLGDLKLSVLHLRAVTILAGLVAAVMNGLTVFASGDGQMMAVRAAAGLAEGVLIWGTTAVVVRSANPERMGGIFFVAQTLAQALFGFLLARWLIPISGWQGGFAALALLSLLTCVLALFQPHHLAPLVAAPTAPSRWSLPMLLPLTVVFLQMATLGSFWAYLEPLGKAAGLDGQSAQTLIAFVLVSQVLGGSISTLAVKRLPVVLTLIAASLALATITLGVRGLPPGSHLAFSGACLAFGFVWLFMLPFHLGLAFRADPSGRLAGLVPAAQLLGSAFGPLMASFTVDGDNASLVPLLSAAFAVCAGVLVLATRRRVQPG